MINTRNAATDRLHIARLPIVALVLIVFSGCGVIGIHETYGQQYHFDNAPKIKAGMTQEQVVALLGEPYVIGQEQNGDIKLKYDWKRTDGRSFVIGVFLSGEKRTVSTTGGSATITLGAASRTVKKIEYSIIGKDNYERIRGGNDVAAR